MIPTLIPPSPAANARHQLLDIRPIEGLSSEHFLSSLEQKIYDGIEEVDTADLETFRNALYSVMQKNDDSTTIPYLDRKFLQSRPRVAAKKISIVRYIGMVQDILEPEYYLSKCNWLCNKYCESSWREANDDLVEANAEIDSSFQLEERQPILLVPIPFSTGWFLKSFASNNNYENYSRNEKKRSAPDDSGTYTELHPSSRPFQRMKYSDIDPHVHTVQGNNDDQYDDDFTICCDWWPPGTMGSDATQPPVLAKLYYDDLFQHLFVNDMVEIFGVTYRSAEIVEGNRHSLMNKNDVTNFTREGNNGSFADSFDQVFVPPESTLPRVHVLYWKKLDLDATFFPLRYTTPPIPLPLDLELMAFERSFAINILSESIFNEDSAAAELFVLGLMSMAERDMMRQPIQMPSGKKLGCASLNFVLPNQEVCLNFHIRLFSVLKVVMPIVVSIELSKDLLISENGLVLPEKRDRLRPSQLQLPKGSCILINRANLSLNTYTEEVRRQLDTLSRMTRDHSIPYRFNGIDFDFESDYCVIVLSVISHSNSCVSRCNDSILPCTLITKINTTSPEVALDQRPIISEDVSDRIRSYIRKCRSLSHIELSQDMMQTAEADFLRRRAVVNHSNVSDESVAEEDFHRWLTLTRLQARSYCSSVANVIHWESSLLLDEKIKFESVNS